MSLNRLIDKQNVAHPYIGLLLSNQEGTSYIMDESQNGYAE